MKLPKINRRTLTAMILGLILSQIYIHTGILNAIMAFMLVGAIPGTSHSLSPMVMLSLYAAIAWVFIFGVLTHRLSRMVSKSRRAVKHHLPKRRLGRI